MTSILGILIILYLVISFSLSFVQRNDYNRHPQNYLKTSLSLLIQPVMEVFGNGLKSHFYDWEYIESDEFIISDEQKLNTQGDESIRIIGKK